MIQNNSIVKDNLKNVPVKRYVKQTTIDFFRNFQVGEEAIIKTSDVKAGVARACILKLKNRESQAWDYTEKGYVDEFYVKRIR